MTTVETEHAFRVYCEGKSCRELYYLSCRERDIRCNVNFTDTLCGIPDRFDTQEIDVGSVNYLGEQGALALVDVLRVNTGLLTLRLPKQGLTDANVAAIIESIENHDRMSVIDLRDNEDVTNASAPGLIKLLQANKMLTELHVAGTGIGKALQRKMAELCHRNAVLEADFFKGDFIRMKRTFCELDSDGSGKISMSELLSQIEIPQVAKALERKFSTIDRGNTRDGGIDMSEFLVYTYPSYRDIKWLRQHAASVEHDEENVAHNWRMFHSVLLKARVDFRAFQVVRVHHKKLTEEEALQLHAKCLEYEWRETSPPVMRDDGWLFLRPKCAHLAVVELFGADFAKLQAARDKTWGPMHIPPSFMRVMMKSFCTAGGIRDVAQQTGKLYEVELDALLKTECKSETYTVQTEVMKQRLRAGGIGPSILFTFPEWVTYVNESLPFALFSTVNVELPQLAPDEAVDE